MHKFESSQKEKVESSQLIPLKPIENVELFIVNTSDQLAGFNLRNRPSPTYN